MVRINLKYELCSSYSAPEDFIVHETQSPDKRAYKPILLYKVESVIKRKGADSFSLNTRTSIKTYKMSNFSDLSKKNSIGRSINGLRKRSILRNLQN